MQWPDFDWAFRHATKLLKEAERKFFDRDKRYTFAGVRFGKLQDLGPGERPPPGISFSENNFVYIEIRPDANWPDQALFQVAHEVIHLLAPTKGDASMLEEGLAVDFSLRVKFPDPNYRDLARTHLAAKEPKYQAAHALYRELIDIDPNAIRKLRKCQPEFSKISEDLICKVIPAVRVDLARQLTECKPMR